MFFSITLLRVVKAEVITLREVNTIVNPLAEISGAKSEKGELTLDPVFLIITDSL